MYKKREKLTKIFGFEYPDVLYFSTKEEYQKFVKSLPTGDQEEIISWHSPDPLLYFYATSKNLTEKDAIAITRTAADPSIAENLLAILYKYALQFPNPQAAIQILHHPNLSEKFILDETHMWKKNLWTSVEGYGEVVSAVALAHPSLTNSTEAFYSSIKNIHWASSHEDTNKILSRNKPKNLFSQESLFLHCLLLPQIKTRPQVLHSLFKLANTSLINLYEDSENGNNLNGGGYSPFDWVSEKVITHPNCPNETLFLLFDVWENTTNKLRSDSPQNSTLLDYHYSVEGLKKLILNVLEQNSCPELFLKQACWSDSPEMRRIASKHPNCLAEDAVAAVLLPNEQDSLFL